MTTRHTCHRLRARIADGLHVEFSAPPIRPGATLTLTCEWDPARPAHLTPEMHRHYRDARDRFVRQLATATRGTALVVET